MEHIINEQPKWVQSACIKVGRRGVSSHHWNPAQLAICLVIPNSHKKWTVDKQELTDLLAKHFKDFLKDWETLSEQL
jgi:hypothetical protein